MAAAVERFIPHCQALAMATQRTIKRKCSQLLALLFNANSGGLLMLEIIAACASRKCENKIKFKK